jgi:hypothetical protein
LGWGLLRANAGTKLVSLALALALWGLLAGEQRAEVTLAAPLELRELPAGLVLAGEAPARVTLRLRGPRSLVAALGPSEVAVVVAGAGLAPGEQLLALRPEDARVPRGVEVLAVTPDRVRLVLGARRPPGAGP